MKCVNPKFGVKEYVKKIMQLRPEAGITRVGQSVKFSCKHGSFSVTMENPGEKNLRQPNEKVRKDDHFGLQNMGSTINIKAAMEPRNFESACIQATA